MFSVSPDQDSNTEAASFTDSLSACRRHNIIHRDIKPGNILIARDGTCKLGDFGVSKTTDRTAGGTKTGTYGFMAPEVYNSRPYNAGVDIRSAWCSTGC